MTQDQTVRVLIALCCLAVTAIAEPKRVYVFVALADNEHQGIAKVPAKIGNGDDAVNNLYWGTTDGFKSVFGRSKTWKLEKTEENPSPEILERRSYRHASKDCVLVAEAGVEKTSISALRLSLPICAVAKAI